MTEDLHKFKIVSFKTPEKLWDEFVSAAHQNGATTTNILEALIVKYIDGEYRPQIGVDIDLKNSIDPPQNPPNLTGIRVLILDDELSIRLSIASILEHYGATVTPIASPAIALQTLQSNPQLYDVLLSDIGMPEQDGWSFIRQVRALSPEAGGKIPAAALTAYASPREIAIAKQVGFQFHLAKPIDANLLVSLVATLANHRSLPTRTGTTSSAS